jgi:hypothetical protein
MLVITNVFVDTEKGIDAKVDYVRNLHKKFKIRLPKSPYLILNDIENGVELPIVEDEKNFPLLTEEQVNDIRRAKISFLKTNKDAILDDEKIEEEKFSYLTNDFQGVSANTPIFYRKTNQAEYYFIFTEKKIEENSLVSVSKPLNFKLGGIEETLAKKFIEALAEAVGGDIAEGILAELFGDKSSCSPEQMKEMFDDLKKFIEDEKIKDIGSYLRTKIIWLRNDYAPIKQVYEGGKESETYKPSDVVNDLKNIIDQINVYIGQVEADKRYYSVNDYENYDRRQLFKLNINLILYGVLIQNELMYWDQYNINKTTDPNKQNRIARNQSLLNLQNVISEIDFSTSGISNLRMNLITGITDFSTDSDHPYNMYAFYDDYIRYDSGQKPDKDDTWISTQEVFSEMWSSDSGKDDAHQRIVERYNSYTANMNSIIKSSLIENSDKALKALKSNYLFYIDGACYDRDDEIYWFFAHDLCFTRQANRSNSLSSPMKISDKFPSPPGLPGLPDFSSKESFKQLAGVVYNASEQNYYFFMEDQYYTYSKKEKKVTDVGKISDKWKGVIIGKHMEDDKEINTILDCVVYRDYNKHYYFFTGKDYFSFDGASGSVSKKSIKDDWNVMERCNAALYSENDGHYYFFKGIYEQSYKAGGSAQPKQLIADSYW